MKDYRLPIHLVLIILFGGVVYSNSFGGPFVLDDLESITNNESIRSLGNFLPGGSGLDFHFRRSVAYFTFALNYHFGGLAVSGYHLFNLVIHLGSALLLYLLLRLTFRTPLLSSSRLASQGGTVALLAALLFVAHPIQTQAVTYIVQRLTSLCTLFYLLALVFYLLARLRLAATGPSERKGLRFADLDTRFRLLLTAAVAAAVLAMFTKEIAFTLPFAALLYEACFFRGDWRPRLLTLLPLLLTLPIIPFLVLTGGELSAVGTLQNYRIDIPRWHYLLTQFPVIATYLRLLIWPVDQNLDYDYPVYTTLFTAPVFSSLLLILALLALAGWLCNRTTDRKKDPRAAAPGIDPAWRLAAFGLFWFFLTLTIESSVMPLADVIFEHRLYLPVVGLCTSLAVGIVFLMPANSTALRRRLTLLFTVGAIITLSVVTWQRNQVWRSELSLWEDVVRKSPEKVRPLYNYGYYLTEAGRIAEAVVILTKVVALDPQHADAWHNLGRAYLFLGNDREALPALRTAVRLAPRMDLATLNLSSALLRSNKAAEALPLLLAVRDRSPAWPEVRFSLGLAYVSVGDLSAARQELSDLQRLNPNLARSLSDIISQAGTP